MVEGRSRYTGPALATAVVLAGLLCTLLTVAGLRGAQRDNARHVMDQRTRMALSAVTAETDRYRDLLETLAAGLADQPALTWAGFDQASAPLAGAGLKGAAAIAFVAPVATAGVAAAERSWRARGASGLTLRPAAGLGEHYFTVFSRNLNEDETVTATGGTDVAGVPQPAAALQTARQTGSTAVSDTYVLLRDRDIPAAQRQHSFVFAAPIWTRANNPVFRGWVVLGLRGGDFLAGVLSTVSQQQLDGSLVAVNSDGTRAEVATLRVPGKRDLRREQAVPVADHVWELTLQADSARLPGAGGHLPGTVLAGGLLLSILLAGLVQVLAGGRYRARLRVEQATTELRAAEAESRRQAGLLGAIMTTIGDGVSVIDADGRMLLENPAARRLTGVTESSDAPERWQRHYGVYRPDRVTPLPVDEMPLIRALHGETVEGAELFVRNPGRPDGVLLGVDARPLDPSAGLRGAVAVYRDVTGLRRYEQDLSIFAGVVAHDLRAPLAIVRGHCELALDDPGDEAEVRSSLGRIIRSVDRMDALIETLLAYSTARDAPLNVVDLDLEPLVREVLQERAASLRGQGGAEPRWSVGPLPSVRADPAMLRHVLDNLVGNAFKYVRPGAVPCADVTAGPAAVPGWTRIEVSDAGIGIPEPEKARVFESFHRAQGSAGYAGTGLGLAICHRVVVRHGGEIGVEDNPGGGTRFYFTLPLSPAATREENDMRHIPAEPAEQEDARVRAALDRALAERAAVLDSRLPGLSALPAADPSAHDPAAARLRAPVPDHQHQD
ncbi:Fis family transcriptional regulator [Actinoplanes sp. SE50]|nr:putative histidine kinase, classic [Actinoplanes sp. SE50/110]ATO84606.1 Fis family transcriptional regulator [Actinoplanes sp. SE50]SLM02016.1 putative histidine kinase, classic [Actinoplanes sp. SE50/110]